MAQFALPHVLLALKKLLKMTTLTKEESIQVALSQLDEMFHDASQPQEKYPRASEVYVDSILEDWGKNHSYGAVIPPHPVIA